jgi:predicted nucleic acid-binding protein
MKPSYFLDTSYIIALEIANEEAHEQVRQNWLTLALSKPFLVTTTYIFDGHEVRRSLAVTFFNSRNLHGKAVEIGKRRSGKSRHRINRN